MNYPKFDLKFSFYNFHGKNFGIWLFTELFTLFTLVRSCFITHTTFIEGPKSLLTHVHDSRRHKSLENFPTYENSQGKEMLLAKLYKKIRNQAKYRYKLIFKRNSAKGQFFKPNSSSPYIICYSTTPELELAKASNIRWPRVSFKILSNEAICQNLY